MPYCSIAKGSLVRAIVCTNRHWVNINGISADCVKHRVCCIFATVGIKGLTLV